MFAHQVFVLDAIGSLAGTTTMAESETIPFYFYLEVCGTVLQCGSHFKAKP